LTAFSHAPLRLMGVVGLGLFVVSMGLAGYYLLGQILYGTPIQGFTTLVILMLTLNSITFVFLGVIGEYLSRIFDDSKGRPRVIIAESTSAEEYPRML
jgi:hypothetical protein